MTINVPPNIVTDIAQATTLTFDAMWQLLIVLVAVPLSFYIMRRILGLFPRR